MIATHFRELFDHNLLRYRLCDVTTPAVNTPSVSSRSSVTDDRSDTDVSHQRRRRLVPDACLDRLEFLMTKVLLSAQHASATGASHSVSAKVTTPQQDRVPDHVVALFKVIPGRAHNSFGRTCARTAGLSSEVLERAEYVSRQLTERAPIAPWLDANDAKREAAVTQLVAQLAKLDNASQGKSGTPKATAKTTTEEATAVNTSSELVQAALATLQTLADLL